MSREEIDDTKIITARNVLVVHIHQVNVIVTTLTYNNLECLFEVNLATKTTKVLILMSLVDNVIKVKTKVSTTVINKTSNIY